MIKKALIVIAILGLAGWGLPHLMYAGDVQGSTPEKYALQQAQVFFDNPIEKLFILHYQVVQVNNHNWESRDFADVPQDYEALVRTYTIFGIKYAEVAITAGSVTRL